MTDHAAQEAMSLRDNQYLQAALDTLRSTALEAMATVEPTDADTIRDHQATVRVIDGLRQRISVTLAEAERKARTKSGVA